MVILLTAVVEHIPAIPRVLVFSLETDRSFTPTVELRPFPDQIVLGQSFPRATFTHDTPTLLERLRGCLEVIGHLLEDSPVMYLLTRLEPRGLIV